MKVGSFEKISFCLGIIITSGLYANGDEWSESELQWWNQQQEVFQQNFDNSEQKPKSKVHSEFTLNENYWKKIKSYFFPKGIYEGYCVLDAYDTKLPLIITKVRSQNAYSIAVDVNVYADDSQDAVDLKLCHTNDLLNTYAWTDSQSVRYIGSNRIYEMYFKLCPLSQYPKINIPGILIPREMSTSKNILTNELKQKLNDGMKSILENKSEVSSLNEDNKKDSLENSQSSNEIKLWQNWFKESLNSLKEINFDFRKHVIEPICTENDLEFIFEKHFGKITTKEEKNQSNQKLIRLSEIIDQMQAQEKELRTEIETLQNRIIELQTEKVDENGNEEKREKPAEEQPVYQTKDGRTIGKLKRVEGDNFLEAIKQYQDDSKNEKSNLSEETIKQLQEESRQKITTKAKENIESAKRAESGKTNGIKEFGSTTSNITQEMNQLFRSTDKDGEFDPKAALKRIKEKDIPEENSKTMEYKNEPKKLELDNQFKHNLESIFGGINSTNSTQKPQGPKPGKLKIDPDFAEKLQNNLGTERKEQETTQSKEAFSFTIPPAPILNLNEEPVLNIPVPTPPPLNLNSSQKQEFYIPPAKPKERNNTQKSLEQEMKRRQEMLNDR